MDGLASQQALGFAGGIDRARDAMNEPSGMIEMSMREDDCSRRKGGQPAKPIRPAIDHDPSLFVHNQQCTVPVVTARAYFDLAARAEKRKFKHIVFCH